MQDKVSIIVPVYNTAAYLDKCVESIASQTYKNLEVLLIDDGATDGSGKLCDRWAEKDSRIRVIHKENGGLSDARNAGLERATGDYIAFVDSDDHITADMIEKLLRALLSADADMSICNCLQVYEDGTPLPEAEEGQIIRDEVLSGFAVIEKMPEEMGFLYHIAWNKLYRKELFAEVRFPKGKLCEDVFIAHRLLAQCGKVACISDSCYYYVQRTGSILHSKSSKYELHEAEAFLDRAFFCSENRLTQCAGHAYWRAAMMLPGAIKKIGFTPEMTAELNETMRTFRENWNLGKGCTRKQQLQIALVLLSPQGYSLLFRNQVHQRAKEARRNRRRRKVI